MGNTENYDLHGFYTGGGKEILILLDIGVNCPYLRGMVYIFDIENAVHFFTALSHFCMG